MEEATEALHAGREGRHPERHLLEKQPISKLCDELGLQPTVFYRWQKEFFCSAAPQYRGTRRAPGLPDMVVERLQHPCDSTPTQAGTYPVPLAAEGLKEPLDIDPATCCCRATKPGLSVQVDESVIARYPRMPRPWSWFRVESRPDRAATSDHSIECAARSV